MKLNQRDLNDIVNFKFIEPAALCNQQNIRSNLGYPIQDPQTDVQLCLKLRKLIIKRMFYFH